MCKDYGNYVRQKQISSDWSSNLDLLEFKMGRKAAETTHHINNTVGPGTATERKVMSQDISQRSQEP
ncbi:hypothetical protein AV530_007337 [Patagioenas fasciata monilis]|uniref:Uncharacterized protein n=1 Tax=Patagioenas fasciata monilis TaxID=372326 RepID=A0A1V4JXM0_PATFA|nr:hypothetical protein AV530_007337 [Patagioenas fasciata monilis]